MTHINSFCFWHNVSASKIGLSGPERRESRFTSYLTSICDDEMRCLHFHHTSPVKVSVLGLVTSRSDQERGTWNSSMRLSLSVPRHKSSGSLHYSQLLRGRLTDDATSSHTHEGLWSVYGISRDSGKGQSPLRQTMILPIPGHVSTEPLIITHQLIWYWCNSEVSGSCGPNRGLSVEEPRRTEAIWQRLKRTDGLAQ